MNRKFIVINALKNDAFADCHIPKSINIPLDQLKQASEQFDKDAEIIVYCASNECPVSQRAWHLLTNMGFTNVRAYEGGIREWKQKGFPTAGPCKAQYLTPPFGESLPEDTKIKTITAEELKKKLSL